MKRALLRWWSHRAERGAALRRAAKREHRPVDAPFYYHTSFGRPRASRYETKLRWQKYFRRVLVMAGAVLAAWLLWQSWVGLRIFAH